jgi:hypothetical protein
MTNVAKSNITMKIQIFRVKQYNFFFPLLILFGLTILRNFRKKSPNKTASNFVGFKSSEIRLRGTQYIEITRVTYIIMVGFLQDIEATRVTCIIMLGFLQDIEATRVTCIIMVGFLQDIEATRVTCIIMVGFLQDFDNTRVKYITVRYLEVCHK